jgi:hypothetical protein
MGRTYVKSPPRVSLLFWTGEKPLARPAWRARRCRMANCGRQRSSARLAGRQVPVHDLLLRKASPEGDLDDDDPDA